jgi:hypothetical protein
MSEGIAIVPVLGPLPPKLSFVTTLIFTDVFLSVEAESSLATGLSSTLCCGVGLPQDTISKERIAREKNIFFIFYFLVVGLKDI